MSEIKGQLLGIVITIGIFGVVFGILTTAFRNAGEKVEDNMLAAVETSEESTSETAKDGDGLVKREYSYHF